MLHTGTYCILVHNISEMNEKNGGNLILHSSRGLTGIRNLIWLDHWEEEGEAAGQYGEAERRMKYGPLPWQNRAQKLEGRCVPVSKSSREWEQIIVDKAAIHFFACHAFNHS